MRAVLVEVPGAMLAERRRLGHDRHDEMWEGELHMVPPPSSEHQRIGAALFVILSKVRAADHHVRYEIGVFDPEVAEPVSYRQPDLAVFGSEVGSERGIEGAAALVVEIRSPGDETLDKVEFYSRVGVREMLVVDRDDKTVRRWSASGGAGLVEFDAPAGGWHRLDAVPLGMRGGGGVLGVDDGEAIHRI